MHVLQPLPLGAYQPRLYVNGFPKSGLHYLELMVGALLDPSRVGTKGTPDLGTYKYNSWTNQLMDPRRYLWRLTCLERGSYLKGHSGHMDEIEAVMFWANIGHIFIYRDLRDVAVSQTYHILSDDNRLAHPHRDFFKMLGGFDEVLSAVIEGIGPYPGVVDRWEKFAHWLDVNWVMSIKFEELRSEPEEWCKAICNYALYNATHLLDGKVANFTYGEGTRDELVEKMIARSEETHLSVTYRKGESGEWQDKFTEEHKALWKQHDPNGWVVRLGYEW